MRFSKYVETHNGVTDYNFEEFKVQFPHMSEDEIMHEYASVLNAMHFLNEAVGVIITEETFYACMDVLNEYDLFLSRFLAIKCLTEHGFEYIE